MRRLILLLTGAALVAALFFPQTAQALTVTGGNPQQRAYIQEVANAGWVDLSPYPVSVRLSDSMGEGNPGLTVGVRATISTGCGALMGEVGAHELSHVDYSLWPLCAQEAWQELVGGTTGRTWTYDQWLHSAVEAWAECSKCLWPAPYLVYDYPRTCLTVPVGDAVRAFREQWVSGRVDTFTDQDWLDLEGWRAVAWVADEALFQGYPDGRFLPYATLTRRHVALIAGRAGLTVPADWAVDYSAALRGDVRQQWPELDFYEEDWGQTITRAQLARLLYRAH